MGLIDASKPRSFRPRGILGPVTEETTSTATTYEGSMGDRVGNTDPSRDLRSFNSVGDYFNDPDVQKNGRALMDMITGASPSMSGFNMATGGYAGMGPQVPAFGINDAVADEIAQAAQGGGGGGSGGMGGMGGQTEGGTSSSGVEGDRGFLYKGGKVPAKGLLGNVDPPGPDNVLIAAKTGERVLNEKQYGRLSPEAQKEVDAVLKAKAKK